MFDGLRQDLKQAARAIVRSPAFALVAIVSLALGIGANTVVFGVLNALILRPLPVANPEQLVFLQRNEIPSLSFPFYRDLRDRNTTLSALVAYRIAPMGLQTGNGARRVWGYLATGNYFDALGVRPAAGRFFSAADDIAPGAAAYAVLSYASWQSRFRADPQIIGRTIRINGHPYAVIGVAPEGFRGTELFYSPEIWVPMMMQPQIEGNSWLENRNTHNSWVLGRLRPEVTPQQAEENLNAVAALVAQERPGVDRRPRLTVTTPGLIGDTLRTPVRSFAWGVMLLAGLVLLAACVNLASLFVARSVDRIRELGIRLALGASQGHLARQLTLEVLLLAAIGGLAGLILAQALLRLLTAWRAPLDIPVQFDVHLDTRVVVFAIVASIVTGLVSALAPMWRVWRTDPNISLRSSSPSWTARPRWAVRDLLLALQVACCCMLITGGIVSLRGLAGAFQTRLGMDPQDVTVTSFDLHLAGYRPENGRTFQRRALEAVKAMPGVVSTAYGSSAPLYIDQSNTSVFSDQTADSSSADRASYYSASPGYFRALGTRLIRGRDFTWRDDAESPRVAIVNETFAKRFGKDGTMGWRFRRGRAGPPIEVVGIVEDGKYQTLTESPRLAVFFPSLQLDNLTTFMVVRSNRSQAEVVAQLRETLNNLDPNLPLYSLGALNEILRFVFVPAWAATIALSAFAILAVMLVITGVYGLAAYSVSSRTREISIRVAIGAKPRQVLQTVLGRASTLLLAGSVVGIIVGLGASRILSSVVYQATPHDPVVLVGVVFAMLAIGVGASWMPARRALTIDPVRALRED